MSQPAVDPPRPQRSAAPRAAAADAVQEPIAVPASGEFEGLLSFQGAACVLGTLRGVVDASGTLRIGRGADVEAEIDVDELVVEGRVRGELRARSRLILTATAEVDGQLHAPRVELREGCRFRGACCSGARASSGATLDGQNTPQPS